MPGVARWTGREITALRSALRMNGRDFAAVVGVSHRMLVKWETGGAAVIPRAANQAALDTMLATAGPVVQERLATLITAQAAAEHDARAEQLLRREVRYSRSPVDGKLMVPVEEGIFLAGPDNKPTWTDAYLIDVYPTTNADYARFVRATGHRAPQHWPQGRCPDSIFDHPVVWVTWHDAAAYAAWAGKALPTSRHWEKAARGSKGRSYPWGDAPTAAKCNRTARLVSMPMAGAVHRTLLEERAYQRPQSSDRERQATFPDWLDWYNDHRAHTGISGHPPAGRVTGLSGQHA